MRSIPWGWISTAWLTLLVVMVLNGISREVLLKKAMSPRMADVLSAVLGVVFILAITRPFLHRLAEATTAQLLAIALFWVVLTVLFEFTFGHYVDRKSWSELVANYNIFRGRLWPLVLTVLAATPFIWTRFDQPTGGFQ